ncbi:MAG: hypothetical protein NPIRA06_31460 [Nitrospirales bacterium]|nr:MAG: hypothetical protein NPIRA06_31460 [Nitrospirales bacterium]
MKIGEETPEAFPAPSFLMSGGETKSYPALVPYVGRGTVNQNTPMIDDGFNLSGMRPLKIDSQMGVLNNKDFQGQICPGLDYTSEAPGRFKKVRPARPQPFLRAERTLSTWARKNDENAAGGFFQQTPNAERRKDQQPCRWWVAAKNPWEPNGAMAHFHSVHRGNE